MILRIPLVGNFNLILGGEKWCQCAESRGLHFNQPFPPVGLKREYVESAAVTFGGGDMINTPSKSLVPCPPEPLALKFESQLLSCPSERLVARFLLKIIPVR